MRVSGLELGGLVGSLVAGKLSDYLISRSEKGGAVGQRVKVSKVWKPQLKSPRAGTGAPHVGVTAGAWTARRAVVQGDAAPPCSTRSKLRLMCCPPDCSAPSQVVMAYTVGIALSLLAFQAVPGSLPVLQWLNVFMIGFFIYGPQVSAGSHFCPW